MDDRQLLDAIAKSLELFESQDFDEAADLLDLVLVDLAGRLPIQAGRLALRRAGALAVLGRGDEALAVGSRAHAWLVNAPAVEQLAAELTVAVLRVEFGDAAGALDQLTDLVGRLGGSADDAEIPPILRAHCLLATGHAYADEERYEEALDALSRAELLYDGLPDRRDQADIRLNVGSVLVQAGQPVRAREYFLRARSILVDLPNTVRDRADCALNLAVTHAMQNDWPTARILLREALRGYRSIAGAEREIADVIYNYALALLADRRFRAARRALMSARARYGSVAADADVLDCDLALARVVVDDPTSSEEDLQAVELVYAAATTHARLLPTRWAEIELDRAELARRRAVAEGSSFLRQAFDHAVCAALVLDYARYQFADARARLAWSRATSDQAWDTALRSAVELGDRHCVTEIILAARMAGVATAGAGRGEHAQALAPVEAVPVMFLGAARTSADRLVRRGPGPRWILADGRVLLRGSVERVERETGLHVQSTLIAYYR